MSLSVHESDIAPVPWRIKEGPISFAVLDANGRPVCSAYFCTAHGEPHPESHRHARQIAEWITALPSTQEELLKARAAVGEIIEKVTKQIVYALGQLVAAEDDGDLAGKEAWGGYLSALRWVESFVLGVGATAPKESA